MINQRLTEKQLDILHDHYKETFARLLKAEALRDRLFLQVIGIFALLILEIGYPNVLGDTLSKFSIGGGEFNLNALPFPALLNATWFLMLVFGLRYCQTAVFVSRQYPYLHHLEDAISPAIGGGDLYRREGEVYLRGYPHLLNVAWFAYCILFPFIAILSTLWLIAWEITKVPYPLHHKLFDCLIAIAFISFFFIYRVQPTIASLVKKIRSFVGL